MKKFKTVLFSLLIGTFALSLIGCGHQTTNVSNTSIQTQKLELPADINLKTFTIKNGLYSIDLPDTWIQDTENTDLLIVDDPTTHLTVMVDYYPISTLEKDLDEQTLDAFIKLYEEKGIPKLLSMAESSELITLETDNLIAAKAYELTTKVDENTTNKAYFVYAQTDKFFYSISISGDESTYTKNIEGLKYIPLTLREY